MLLLYPIIFQLLSYYRIFSLIISCTSNEF